MAMRTVAGREAQSSDPWRRVVRRLARPAAWGIRLVLGGWLLWITYLVLNPASVDGRVVRAWDGVTGSQMRDLISTLRRWQVRRLPDGTVVALEPGGWVRYPARFDGPVHAVYLEGSGTFVVNDRTAPPFEVRTRWGTVRGEGGPVALRIDARRRLCSVTAYVGRIAATANGILQTVSEGYWLDCTDNSFLLRPGVPPREIP